MKLAFRIALRFLTSSKGQTILIAMGIAIGISVQIFIGSLIEGLQVSLVDSTIGRSSHISILPEDKNEPLEDVAAQLTWLQDNASEIKAISPTLTKGAFITLDDATEQILFRGFDMEKSTLIYKWDLALVSGTMDLGENEVAIGVTLAEENGIALGDTVEIITPDRTTALLKVVGFIDLKVAAVNKTWMVGRLGDAQTIFQYEDDQATAIEIQVTEPFDADIIAARLLAASPFELTLVDNWKAQNEQLLSGLSGQSTSSLMIQVFVVISVVLGIASVLAITVLQKSRQIGILKAMGISDRVSSLVFLFQGIILGILGGVLGIAFGLGLLWTFTKFALNADGTPVVPIFINLRFIALSGGIAVAASTFASVIPALKSKNLSVIEVIKNG